MPRSGRVLIFLPMVLAGCGGPSGEVRELNRRGLEHYRRAEYPDAISVFEKARESDRETPEPAYYIGCCYLRMADQKFREDSLVTAVRLCDNAIRAFTAADEAFPGYTHALQGKSEALKRKGHHQAALELADWAASHCGPSAKKHIFRAREYAQHGDVDKALTILQEAVRLEPDNAAAHAELGRFYARFDKRDAAMLSLQKALELDPKAPGVEALIESLEGAPSESSLP